MINNQIQNIKLDYISYCASRKNLDNKTIKSYCIDLSQYECFIEDQKLEWLNKKNNYTIHRLFAYKVQA